VLIHPDIIDSINQLQGSMPFPEERDIAAAPTPAIKTPCGQPVKPKVPIAETPAEKDFPPSAINTPEEKFSSRKKLFRTIIPITSEKIELRFYDNAQVDGDSIALFLNNRMIFKNIRLNGQKRIRLTLNASELGDDKRIGYGGRESWINTAQYFVYGCHCWG
jgi:hypothetical protein